MSPDHPTVAIEMDREMCFSPGLQNPLSIHFGGPGVQVWVP